MLHGMRIALVGVLVAGSGLAWAEPPGKHGAGSPFARFKKAISVQDWAAPPAPGDATAQANSAAPAAPDSPLPEEPQAAPAEPAAPAAETPAAPVEALPELPPPPAPLPPVEPLEPQQSQEPALPPPPAAEPAQEEGPSLLERAVKLEDVNVDELYREYQRSFPGETLNLTLEEAVYRALKANQDILVRMYDPLKAGAAEFAAEGEFDPQVYSGAQYLRATQSASSEVVAFGGITSLETFQTTSQSGVQGKLPWGTMYNVQFNLAREQTTFSQLREQWYGGLTLSLTQPLLRGAGLATNRAQVRLARNSRLAAESQLRGTVLSAVADTVRGYWDLVGAIQNVEARRKAVENAERLLEIQRKRLELETAAEIEVVQAQAGVTARKSDLISAQAQVENASDSLKNLLGLIDEDLVTPVKVNPVDSPTVTDIELNEVESTALALKNRPEIEGAEIQIESARIEQKRAANQLLPQFDVTGSLTQGGRGDYARDVFNGVRDKDDKSYTVGFQGSVPIGNRAARGSYQQAQLSTRQAQQQLEQTRQAIILNVQLALNNVAATRVLVESTRQTVNLQEINLEAEEKRLELGVSTTYQVLEIEEDLTLARTQYIQAMANYQKALTDLRLAEGVLLDLFGIEFEPPEREKPVSYLRSVVPWPVE